METSDTLKRCGRCKEWLPIEMFGLKRSSRDGLNHICRDCRTASVHPMRSLRFEHGVAGTDHLTLGETVALKPQEQDRTLTKVYQSFWWWINHEILTQSQAEAIMMHAVDMLDWSEIGRMCEIDRTVVAYHYNNGIRNLRETYGVEVAG